VGAVGRARADRADRRRGGVDDDVLRVAEAVRGARRRQRQRRVVGGRVRDRAAVQRERGGGAVVEVGGGVAGLPRVVDGRRRGARAGGVVGGSRGGRGVESQLRRAGDGDVL